MNENDAIGFDSKTLLMNKAIGIALVGLGIYGLYFAYKIYTQK